MSLPFTPETETIDSAAHLIQIALTPVFMLSGIGSLINVFNTRLARVSDHLEDVTKRLNTPSDDQGDNGNLCESPHRLRVHQIRLRRRIFVLDLAIILNAMGGAATCGAALVLFIGSLRDSATSTWLLSLFGIALACTVAALTAFFADTLLSWHGMRREGKASLLNEKETSPTKASSS
ncbi:DUF2721 domain-containing protein [Saccharibacter floricola]|uniref:DUF2721 domain-containing protein n=1 Tax=Saccharibacter floricola DSM 15669 TaxID=1123227 RepID=A0ABQ0NZ79_9PROT|nr:DUF2721 domain-containing protein [Saccharibacter floricola]GBQ06497.1 hypothetical protein AA15669_0964 [Saccharibacter floricola DSM 15669]